MEQAETPSPTAPVRNLNSDRPRSKSSFHKKSNSGNILSRRPFFRTTPEVSPVFAAADDTVPFPDVPDMESSELLIARSSALSTILDSHDKSRKRKGSLRKAALLATGKLRVDRRPSGADVSRLPKDSTKFIGPLPTSRQDAPPLEHTGAELAKVPTSRDAQPASISPVRSPPTLLSPLTSPTGTGPYISTTDEDDSFTIPSTTGSMGLPSSKPSPSPSPPSSESSLAHPPSMPPRRASHQPKFTSPLSTAPSSFDSVGEWDYSATEWWGWIILLVTWIVFVVGMGSCLEVWSWAWDVGEKPDAPPELEDDPTLPIVGYYPALIILTAVMSWVWVVVAWMGMKYFKHARTHEYEHTQKA